MKDKKPSIKLLIDFVESIISSFHLEDNFINNNVSLGKKLNSLEPSEDYFIQKFAIKLIENGEPFKPTILLRKILTDLINKRIGFDNLPIEIENNLRTPQDTSTQISEKIKTNPLVIKELESKDSAEYFSDQEINNYLDELLGGRGDLSKEPLDKKQLPKGINQDLL